MNRLHAALPAAAKKCVWDMKYGLLGYPQWVAPNDAVHYLSAWLSESSSVLDLGCGRGSLLRALREGGWIGSYCGVDISKRAISDAHRLGDHRSSWVVSEFESFRSPLRWDAVAMIESVCYVTLGRLPAFLTRVMGMLNDNGIFLFRLHDLEKYREYVEAIRRLYPQTEKVAENLFCVVRYMHSVNQ